MSFYLDSYLDGYDRDIQVDASPARVRVATSLQPRHTVTRLKERWQVSDPRYAR